MSQGLLIKLFAIALLISSIAGCASEPVAQPINPSIAVSAALPTVVLPVITPNMPGIYHRVEKGETLWRICKSYNVDLDEVVQLNRIADSTNIEVGQKLFIPGAKKQESLPVACGNNDDFIWPVKGRVISNFGQIASDCLNKGINIQPSGDPNVVAVRRGKVVYYCDDFGVFGKTLIIDHGDGISTVYARNSEIFVKAGDIVQKGMVLAKAGSAGRDKRTYLHFEVRKGHTPQNPLFYLP